MDYEKILQIDPNDLDGELIMQPANYAFIAQKAIEAELKYEKYKNDMEVYSAKLDKIIRENFENEGKKFTESVVTREINLDPEYGNMRRKLLELKAQREVFKSLRESMFQKSQILIQLSKKQINEYSQLVALNEQ
jgi:hypothetical protein